MPGVVGGLAASEAAGVLADDLAVTPDNDAIGIGAQLGSAPRRLDRDAVAVVVEAHQAALRHRDLDFVEARRTGQDRRSGWPARPRRPPRQSCRSAWDARSPAPGRGNAPPARALSSG